MPKKPACPEYVVELWEGGDSCSLIFVVAIVTYIGHLVVGPRHELRTCGQFIGGAAFLMFAGFSFSVRPPGDSADLVGAVFKSLLASGIVLGLAWTLLPGLVASLRFIRQCLRSLTRFVAAHGIVLTLGVGGAALCYLRVRREVPLPGALGAALVAGLSTAAIARLIPSRLWFVWQRVVLAPLRRALHARRWRLGAKQRLENAEVLRRTQAEQIQATRRRRAARAKCELYFARFAPEVSERFPRSELDRFLEQFMNDQRTPEEAERRAKELIQIIDHHHQSVRPDTKLVNFEQLATWFQSEREKIERLSLAQDIKEVHLIELDKRYADLSREFLQKAQP